MSMRIGFCFFLLENVFTEFCYWNDKFTEIIIIYFVALIVKKLISKTKLFLVTSLAVSTLELSTL